MYSVIHIQNPVHNCKFRYLQAYACPLQTYCGIFRIMCNSCIFRILTYLEPRYIQNSVKAYSERCVTLAYSEPCRIQNFGIGPEAYSESCLCGHSGIFNNDSYNKPLVSFFHFNLAYFLTKFKKATSKNTHDAVFNLKCQTKRSTTLLKRDSGICALLRISQKF